MDAPDELAVPVSWYRFSLWSLVERRSFAPTTGVLSADRLGIRVLPDRGRGGYRWTWDQIEELRLVEGIASSLVVDASIRPHRRKFALAADGHPMLPQMAEKFVEQLRDLAIRVGWKPAANAAHLTYNDRAQRFAARTAWFKARYPDAYVVRVVTFQAGAGNAVRLAGLAFAGAARYGHLVADAGGLRLFQGPDDLEWEKTWREITLLAVSKDNRGMKLDAVGWHAPKNYAPCEPKGDVLLPFAVGDILAQLRARRPGAGVR